MSPPILLLTFSFCRLLSLAAQHRFDVLISDLSSVPSVLCFWCHIQRAAPKINAKAIFFLFSQGLFKSRVLACSPFGVNQILFSLYVDIQFS